MKLNSEQKEMLAFHGSKSAQHNSDPTSGF